MSASPFDADLGDRKFLGCHLGTVVDRLDPEGLGRVRASIPGLIDRSAWAMPLTIGGGAPDSGIFFVPPIGADVAVWFAGGDLNQPVYSGAHWGKPGGVSEVPAEAQPAPGAEPSVIVIATPSFRVEINETPGARTIRMTSVTTGENLTFDAETRQVGLGAVTRLYVQALGLIEIDAAQINIGGRPVRMGEQEGPI